MKLLCFEVEAPTCLFTPGKTYEATPVSERAVYVKDDLGYHRCMSLHPVDGSAAFIIRNDWPTALPRHAHFKRAEEDAQVSGPAGDFRDHHSPAV